MVVSSYMHAESTYESAGSERQQQPPKAARQFLTQPTIHLGRTASGWKALQLQEVPLNPKCKNKNGKALSYLKLERFYF